MHYRRSRRANANKTSCVVMKDHNVEKLYTDPDTAYLERIRSRNAAEVGRKSGTFHVPEIVSSSDFSTTWDRVTDASPLRVELSKRHGPDLAESAGRALGTIHSRLTIPENLRRVAPPPFGMSPVFVHGDFSLNNVQYRRQADEIVIFDWASANWLGSEFTHASPALDCSMFLADLYYQRPNDPARVPQADTIARSFLRGYRQIVDLDQAHFKKCLRAVSLLYLRKAHSGWQRSLRTPSLMRLNLLTNRLNAN